MSIERTLTTFAAENNPLRHHGSDDDTEEIVVDGIIPDVHAIPATPACDTAPPPPPPVSACHRRTRAAPEPSDADPPPSSTRKRRTEFTAAQKLDILSELASSSACPQLRGGRPTVRSITRKYNVSKSSLFRWKQPEMRSRLRDMAEREGKADKKRDVRDPLVRVKEGVTDFCRENDTLPTEERLMVTTAVIRAKGAAIAEELLRGHERKMLRLGDEEVRALRAFKATKSWAGKVGKELGWLGDGMGKQSGCGRGGGREGEGEKEAADATTDEGDASERAVEIAERTRQNTQRFLASALPPGHPSAGHPPKAKRRREFTCREKIAILEEISRPSSRPLTIEQICQKYDTSKSSLFRWRAQYKNRSLQETRRGEGKRLRQRDRFAEVKAHLRRCVADRLAAMTTTTTTTTTISEKRMAIFHTAVLQEEARRHRDEILARHDRQSCLDEDTAKALRSFKASKAWIRKVVREWEWDRKREFGDGDGDENDESDENDDGHEGGGVDGDNIAEVKGTTGFDGGDPRVEVFDGGGGVGDVLHEIDLETIIDGVPRDHHHHHHHHHHHYDHQYEHHDQTHIHVGHPHSQNHPQYDHHDQDHPQITVMAKDEQHAHPYSDDAMHDYTREMAEEAVDATMTLVADMANVDNLGRIDSLFPSHDNTIMNDSTI